MFTSTLVALASLMSSTPWGTPSWHADYGLAQILGKAGHKPLAVFIGSGRMGWNQISQEGRLAEDVRQVLAKNYICVYVDTDLETGRELASDFEVPKGLGLIVSDHTGRYQAFRHEGDLPDEKLLRHLDRYANPERIVQITETNSRERPSYSAESYPTSASYYQPIRYSPGYWGGTGQSC